MTLALHIIAKDEGNDIQRIIDKYSRYFDEVVIAIDDEKTYKHFKEISDDKIKILKYEWINDFADKRNFVVKNTESSYYLRMDTDDDIDRPEKIRQVFDEMVETGTDVTYVEYIYARDEDGNTVAKHWRETIVKIKDDIYWKKTVHENLHIEDMTDFKGRKDNRFKIIHNADDDHLFSSSERNLKILLAEFNKDKENTDPRTISYIGRMLLGASNFKAAIPFLELLIKKSGWDDDKYFAWIQLAQCQLELKEVQNAIAACNEALAIRTEYPDAYLMLCEIYLGQGMCKKAIDWGLIGIQKKEPDTMAVLDSSTYGYRALFNLALAYFGTGDFDRALQFIKKAKDLAPSNKFIRDKHELFSKAFENNDYVKRLLWMINFIKERDPKRADKKLKTLMETIPRELFKDERIHGITHALMDPVKWDDNSVVIFCGNSWEEWAPPSTITGIGGSEEAVIYLSKELVKLGYKVTVFNEPGDMEGNYDGVEYRPFYEYNPRDEFNVFISWRRNMFRGGVNARKKILWLHDVPHETQFKHQEFDKVLVLSEFHKSLLKDHNVPEEKIFISANGINLEDFKEPMYERNPKRIIHTSSYDRGIQHLLQMWPEVRKEVPDAELHLFYGWETYDKMILDGMRSADFKEKMLTLINQEGVIDHGRVGHKKLIEEFQKSGIYAYPCHFEEISCISAMKAQACGCVPVVTDYAALKETIRSGFKVEGNAADAEVRENYKRQLIEVLKDSEKQEESRKEVLEHREEFGWDKVAQQWHDHLFR